MKAPHDLLPDTKCCVADGITAQRDILPFRRAYLCSVHRKLWDTANENDRRKEERRTDKEMQ